MSIQGLSIEYLACLVSTKEFGTVLDESLLSNLAPNEFALLTQHTPAKAMTTTLV